MFLWYVIIVVLDHFFTNKVVVNALMIIFTMTYCVDYFDLFLLAID